MKRVLVSTVILLWPLAKSSSSVVPVQSEWERYGQMSRYDNSAGQLHLAEQGGGAADTGSKGYKSPLKAGLLSLAIPGLGQYYYGSRVKPFVFFGIEVAAWALHIKYHNDGESRTDEYEAFQRAHWSEADYFTFLQLTYQTSNEDSLHDNAVVGFSHTLPEDRNSQQFFELTGKYNQYSWGWDDAYVVVGGSQWTLGMFDSSNAPPVFGTPNAVPYSPNRFIYEDMRNGANNSYDNAKKMIFVSLANRLISGLEAYISTKSRNRHVAIGDDEFGTVLIKPRFRSIYSFSDTPYLSVHVRW